MTAADWRRSRVLLIGQAPGPTGPPPGRALVGGRSGEFLRSLTGCSLRGYLYHFETTNLLPKYPGRSRGGKGDRFSMVEARHHAAILRPTLSGRIVVFVGLAVAEAFDWVSPVEPFSWRLLNSTSHSYEMYEPGKIRHQSFRAAAIPHPSGIVTFWNEPANVERGRRFFGELLNSRAMEWRALVDPIAKASEEYLKEKGYA